MTKKQRKELLESAERIISNETYCICAGMEIPLGSIKEVAMFFPYEYYGNVSPIDNLYWWGLDTTGNFVYSKQNKQARLIAIAFMITMPKDML